MGREGDCAMHSDPSIELHAVALRVHDAARSADFYHRVFGLISRPAASPSPAVWVCSARARTGRTAPTIILIQGLPLGTQPIGMDHLSLRVDRPEDVIRSYRRALAAQADATAPRWYGGRYQTYIFDPDGYKIDMHSNCAPDRDESPVDNAESGHRPTLNEPTARDGPAIVCRGPPRRPRTAACQTRNTALPGPPYRSTIPRTPPEMSAARSRRTVARISPPGYTR